MNMNRNRNRNRGRGGCTGHTLVQTQQHHDVHALQASNRHSAQEQASSCTGHIEGGERCRCQNTDEDFAKKGLTAHCPSQVQLVLQILGQCMATTHAVIADHLYGTSYPPQRMKAEKKVKTKGTTTPLSTMPSTILIQYYSALVTLRSTLLGASVFGSRTRSITCWT